MFGELRNTISNFSEYKKSTNFGSIVYYGKVQGSTETK